MGCVLIDGPRRLAMIVVAVLGLLIGVGALPVPSVASLASLAVGVGGLSAATVVLSQGRISVGDRLRWTYGSIGELLIRDDVEGVAPRRWVGTVGTIVVVNLAVALRGISDRWTHGLPTMENDLRIVAMVYAMTLVAGSLFTLVTTAAPQLDNAHLVSRGWRSARRASQRSAARCASGSSASSPGSSPGASTPVTTTPAGSNTSPSARLVRPSMTEAVNHTPPRLGIRVSIPPRWRTNERTTPEWATTNAAGGSRPQARVATSPSALAARATTAEYGSNVVGRWCASSQPGHCISISSGVRPSHSPACASRSRWSTIGSPRPSLRAMIAAVSDARRRSLVQMAGNSSRSAASRGRRARLLAAQFGER